MEPEIVVWDLSPEHSVAELPEPFTGGLALELHIAVRPEGGTIAWWTPEDVAWIRIVKVGDA